MLQASSDVVHAHARTYMYLNDVDAGVAIVRADPLVDENTIVILSQRRDQFQPIKIALTPRGIDNRPAADRRQKSPQGGVTPLLNCFWNEQCSRGVHSLLTAATEQNTLQVPQTKDALVHEKTWSDCFRLSLTYFCQDRICKRVSPWLRLPTRRAVCLLLATLHITENDFV